MLEDSEGKNYKFFEKSNIMKENRKADHEHKLAWKLVPSDYDTQEERIAAYKRYTEDANHYEYKVWKQMKDERDEYYRDKFEYDTVDALLEMLPDSNLDHKMQVQFLSCIMSGEHSYEVNINASKSASLIDEAKAVDRSFMQIMTGYGCKSDWIEA